MPSTTPDLRTVTAGCSTGGGGGVPAPALAMGDVVDNLLARPGGDTSLPLARSGLGQASSKFAGGVWPPSEADGGEGSAGRASARSRSLRTLDWKRRLRFGLAGGGGVARAGSGETVGGST